MPIAPPLPVLLHACAAIAALLLGIVLVARRMGARSHRWLGWTWVALMAVVAVSSLWIPGFLRPTPIHALTVLTLVTLPLAVRRARHGDIAGHARAMKGLFGGALVVAGLLAFLPGRLLGDLVVRGLLG